MDTTKKKELSANVIVGVFNFLDKFFASDIKKMFEDAKIENQDIFTKFDNQFKKAGQYNKSDGHWL